MIDIHIRLYGLLRDRLPAEARGRTRLSLPGGSTVQDVLQRLEIRRLVSFTVNGEVELQESHPLSDGDKVEIFRPSAGG